MTQPTEKIDTRNRQFVGAMGDRVVVAALKGSMTADEAISHAAWLVAVAECLDPTHPFEDVYAAVSNT